jgi:hypothetical protein
MKQYTLKTHGGSGGIYPQYLTSATDRGEWSDSWLGHFTLWEIAPRTHWIGDWVSPRAGLEAVEMKNLALPEMEFRLSSPLPT